jgi:hypothetical protein
VTRRTIYCKIVCYTEIIDCGVKRRYQVVLMKVLKFNKRNYVDVLIINRCKEMSIRIIGKKL